MEQDVRRVIAELAMAVLTANGRISAAVWRALERLDALGFGPISSLCKAELPRSGDPLKEWERICTKLAFLDVRDRAAIVGALAEIAASDDHVCGREIERVNRVACLLGLPIQYAVSSLNSAVTKRAMQRSALSG